MILLFLTLSVGCGKTTQRKFHLYAFVDRIDRSGVLVPQFVLDSLIITNRGSSASILVTQPRRLSAVGVAARVSTERLDDGSVGYAIRGESKQDFRTKLLFCTTGIVLRRLGSGDTLEDVTHVIVDEVFRFLFMERQQLKQCKGSRAFCRWRHVTT